MRCYFMRQRHIADVAVLPALNDQEAVEKARELVEARKGRDGFEGFEVWDRARKLIKYPPPEGAEGVEAHQPSS